MKKSAYWTLDLTKYAETQKVNIREFLHRFVYNLYSNVVKITPVDSGRCRGNWNIGIGFVNSAVNPNAKKPQYTSKNKMPKADNNEPYFISNHLRYAPLLEFGGYPNPPKNPATAKTVNGYSKQAPNGMVRVTLANKEPLLQDALMKSKRKTK